MRGVAKRVKARVIPYALVKVQPSRTQSRESLTKEMAMDDENENESKDVSWQELFERLDRCRGKWAELGITVGE